MIELAKLIVFEVAYQYWHWRFDVPPTREGYGRILVKGK